MAYFNSNTMDVTSYKGQILSKGAKLVTLVENTNFHLKFIYSPLRIGVQSVLPGNEKWVAPLTNVTCNCTKMLHVSVSKCHITFLCNVSNCCSNITN